MTSPAIPDLSHSALKDRERAIRGGFPEDLGLRVHRALSWLHRAEQEMARDAPDLDAAYVFYWVSFNAAYADDRGDAGLPSERSKLQDYFALLMKLDRAQQIYHAIWNQYSQSIRSLLSNKYVYEPFWKFHNQVPGYDNWEERFERSKELVTNALREQNTRLILSILFDRLYVLRNQLVHGGATWNSSANRHQVQDGARILALLVPLFVSLMMDNPDESWGAPFYPVV